MQWRSQSHKPLRNYKTCCNELKPVGKQLITNRQICWRQLVPEEVMNGHGWVILEEGLLFSSRGSCPLVRQTTSWEVWTGQKETSFTRRVAQRWDRHPERYESLSLEVSSSAREGGGWLALPLWAAVWSRDPPTNPPFHDTVILQNHTEFKDCLL